MVDEGSVLTIVNLPLTTAGTVYSYEFPTVTRTLTISCRQGKDVYVSKTADFATYFTIPGVAAYYENSVIWSGSLYFKCNTSDVVLELILWSKYF
jgi:hypothetical protein